MKKTRSAFALASALASVVAMAISSGCTSKISKCSSDSECPSGTCDLSVNRCAFVVCGGGTGCPGGTYCNTQVANLCVPIPDGGTNDCAPACPSYQLCVSTQCLNRYSGITLGPPPQDGAFLDGGTPVLAQLNLSPGLQRLDPPFLTLAISLPNGGTTSSTLALTNPPGAYQGALVPAGDGRYQLTARYDAASLSSAPVTVTILTARPSFIVTVPPPPPGPNVGYLNSLDPGLLGDAGWRRDQIVPLGIASANPYINPGTVTLTVTGLGGRPSANPPVTTGSGCGQPYCATALVDLSLPDMSAFRGTFGLIVTGTDRAGNVGTTDAGVVVTRWKWAFRTLDGLPIKTSPAIGSSGTVYVGTSNGTDAGTLYAINPDGTIKWSSDAGWISASVAVGDLDGGVETVYAAVNDPVQATIHAINGTNGADLVPPCIVPGTATRASLAVTRIDGGELCFAAINSSDGGVMLAMQPFPLPRTCIDGGSVTPGGTLLEPAAVAVDNNNNVFFALSSLRIQSLTFDGGWQVRSPPNWPVDAGANNVGLAVVGSPAQVVGSSTTAGGDGGVFAIAASNGVQTWTFTDAGDRRTGWNPSVATGGTVFFGDDGQKLTSVAIGSITPSAQITDAGVSRGAPILGGSDGTIYIADSLTNAIFARSSSLTPIWSVNSFNGNPFEASLALDCSRDGGVAMQLRPGVLYAPDNTRNLFCFITDSRGIDFLSPWPKYQHDPRNTGNQQTPLSQFACP